MKTVYNIAKYIFKNNSIVKTPFYLCRAFLYQIFKRLTNNVISIKLFNGRRIFLFPHSNVSTVLVYTDIPDKAEVQILRKYSTDHTIFLDIGANIGSYSVLLMDKIKDIYAFEPHPSTSKKCRMNFLLNGYDDKNVIQSALSDAVGEIYFTNDETQTSINKITTDINNSIKVKSDTLDNFAAKYLDKNLDYIIKIDAEGFEYNIINGGINFLSNYKINCIVFEDTPEYSSKVQGSLRSLGYEVTKINDCNSFAIKTQSNI